MLSLTVIAAASFVSVGPVGRAVALSQSPAPIPFTLLVMDHFGNKNMIAAVRRTAGPNHQDLIAIKKSELNSDMIVVLARALQRSVETRGSVPLRPISMYFTKHRKNVPMSADERSWANTLIAQSTLAQVKDCGRLGKHQATDPAYTPSSSPIQVLKPRGLASQVGRASTMTPAGVPTQRRGARWAPSGGAAKTTRPSLSPN